jgi:hypothetical protein
MFHNRLWLLKQPDKQKPRKVSEVNRSALLEIEDATPANVALDINELCGHCR